jgi:tRNA dimethylallyltransferase
MMKRKKIVFIIGPTASGKSKLALSLAKKICGEIVSCDSMQVYRGLDILSSKPPKSEQKKVRHNMIDIVGPGQNFNVNKFVKISNCLIGEIHKRGNAPIFVGGTGLYLDCLLNGLFQSPEKNAKIRNELYEKAKIHGNEPLYRELKKVDPVAASKIHPHDLRRIVRALEVYTISKRPISDMQKERSGILGDGRFKVYIFGISIPREELYKRINKRVDLMFKNGAVREVEKLTKKRCSKTFKQALGVKEIIALLEGQISYEQAKILLKRNTRRYAKRQITWFKKNTMVHWLKTKHLASIMDSIE